MNGLLSPTDNAGDDLDDDYCPLVTKKKSFLSPSATITSLNLEEIKEEEAKSPRPEKK